MKETIQDTALSTTEWEVREQWTKIGEVISKRPIRDVYKVRFKKNASTSFPTGRDINVSKEMMDDDELSIDDGEIYTLTQYRVCVCAECGQEKMKAENGDKEDYGYYCPVHDE